MTKQTEAMKLALKQAFDLGQTYCSWAASEYQNHWKKADATKERFNQLVEDTISKALPAQQTDWEAVAADQAMTIGLLKAVQPAQPATYTCGVCGVSMQMEQPAQPQQEPVAWMSDNDIGFKKSEFGATPTVPLYTSPPASKPLTDEQIKIIWRDIDGSEGMLMRVARAIEAAHGITGETE